MAISTKGKRKITVDGHIFYWYIKKGELTIISDDKQLIVVYDLGASTTPLRIEKAPNRQRLTGRPIRLNNLIDEIRPKDIADFIRQLLEE